MSEVKLYLGDCLDILPTLEAGSVDAVITSPPYGIGKAYDIFYPSDGDNYLSFLEEVFSEVRRLTACFWLNVGYRKLEEGNIPIAFQVWDKVGMYLMQHITWEYGAGMTYRKRFNHRSEDWLWFVNTPHDYIFNGDAVRDIALTEYPGDKRNNANGKLPGDVWYFSSVKGTSKERCQHPAQYPEAMIERIIKATSNEGATILDPFMGSGTTGVACVKTGRNFIGIEIDPDYYAIAEKRIAEAQMQLRLPL